MTEPATNVLKILTWFQDTGQAGNLESLVSRPGAGFTDRDAEVVTKWALAGIRGTLAPVEEARRYEQCFDLVSSGSNPPDLLIKRGDAIEVKTTSAAASDIQLNSSPPTSRVTGADSRVSVTCRRILERSGPREQCYVFYFKREGVPTCVLAVDGALLAAPLAEYELRADMLTEIIESGAEKIGLSYQPTNELGRVRGFGHDAHTKLRVRGMWLMRNPLSILREAAPEISQGFKVAVLLRDEKLKLYAHDRQQALEAGAREYFLSMPDPETGEVQSATLLAQY